MKIKKSVCNFVEKEYRKVYNKNQSLNPNGLFKVVLIVKLLIVPVGIIGFPPFLVRVVVLQCIKTLSC